MASIVTEIFILCTVFFLKTEALEEANIIREFIITTPNSMTVPLGQHLYTVTKNRSHVHINTTDAHVKPCTITIDPFEDMIQDKMKVESAANREILVWGVQSQEIKKNVSNTYYSLLWIDPWACSYKSILLPKSDDAVEPKNFLPRLVRYGRNSRDFALDVFFPSLNTCAPCTFTQDGNEFYTLVKNLVPEGNTSDHSFHIVWMNPNYFYVQNLNNSRSVLKYLKSFFTRSFSTITQKYLDYTVDTIAFRKGSVRSVGICTKIHGPYSYAEVRCERLNSKLQSVASIHIPTFGNHVSSVSLEYDDHGNSFISFATGRRTSQQELLVYIYDLDGQLLQSYNLGKVDKRFVPYHNNPIRRIQIPHFTSRYSFWDVHGFLVGKQYCVIVERTNMNGNAGPLHNVKCIDVSNYYNKSKF